MDINQFNGDLLRLAEAVKQIDRAGYVRQSILLRLCVGGVPLHRAVGLHLVDIVKGNPTHPQPDVDAWASIFDPYCRRVGAQSLSAVLLRYLIGEQLLSRNADGDYDLEVPAFPSRKGGHPITTRTAERQLIQAWRSCNLGTPITFRDVIRLGRMHSGKRLPDSALREATENAFALVKKMDWFFTKLFSQDQHAKEDAKQSALLALLEANADGKPTLDETSISQLLYKSGRQSRKEYVNNRINCVVGLPLNGSQLCQKQQKTRMDKHSLKYRISKVLRTLSYREREILKLRYGFPDSFTFTLLELVYIFKILPERVRQIEQRAIRSLQQPSRAQFLVDFVEEKRKKVPKKKGRKRKDEKERQKGVRESG